MGHIKKLTVKHLRLPSPSEHYIKIHASPYHTKILEKIILLKHNYGNNHFPVEVSKDF